MALIHDEVVETLGEFLEEQEDCEVCTNPGAEKNCDVDEVYPDVLQLAPDDPETVEELFEVEAPGKITDKAVRKWRDYQDTGLPLTIVVHESDEDEALDRIEAAELDVELGTYAEISDEEIHFEL